MKFTEYHKYNKRYFRSAAVNTLSGKMPDLAAQRPILVTGSHRSGTTIIGTLLAESPETRYVYEPLNPKDGVYMSKTEFGVCNVCKTKIPTYFLKIDKTNQEKYIPHFKHLLNAKVLLGKRPILKSPFTMFASEWIAERYGAKVIVLIRSPLGFVSSLKKMNWDEEIDGLVGQKRLLTGELTPYEKSLKKYINRDKYSIVERSAIMWSALYSHAATLREQHPEWLFVRLEDFQHAPVSTMSTMYDYVGLDFIDKAKRKTKEMTGTHNPAESSIKKVHSIKRDAKKAAKTWKGRLTDKEVAVILDIVGDDALQFYTATELQ